MPVGPGTRLGRYEIRALIGAGGMGEVYRARDPQIAREVAIKVLPASFSADPERLRRFEQEAQAAGALNHPNILSIYDVGVDGATPFVVAELLEGATLRDRMDGAALPARTALDYARQIASGLAAAHDGGIVHRDLKPENVFVGNDGRVKILDFGLAKLIEQPQHSANRTAAAVTTAAGAIVGTVGYMSPEQVRGQQIDHRTDIFSFGAILYEMLSGRRAFFGGSVVDTMTAILREEPPPLHETNGAIAPALGRVVVRCLHKNPQQRFQSANDLGFTLESLPENGAALTAHVVPPSRAVGRAPWGWIVAALATIAAIAVAIARWPLVRTPPQDLGAIRFTISAPAQSTFAGLGIGGGQLALSPDGRRLVFAAPNERGGTSLWLRSLASPSAQPLGETEGATFPFWSPDSRSIGFFANRKLRILDVSAGVAVDRADAPSGTGGTWSPAGIIVFAPKVSGPLYEIPDSGGVMKAVTSLDPTRHEVSHRWPCFLPDGRHFLYATQAFLSSASPDDVIYGTSTDGSGRKLVVRGASNVAFSDGYLLFSRGGQLLVQTFDPVTLETSGGAVPAVNALQGSPSLQRQAFSASPNGVLAYQLAPADTDYQLTWKDRSGRAVETVGDPSFNNSPAISPDQTRVAVQASNNRGTNIQIYDLKRGAFEGLTSDLASSRTPAWSPDGTRIVFCSTRSGPANLYLKSVDGSANEELLVASANDKYAKSWSTNGYVLYYEADPVTRNDLWIVPVTGDRKPIPFLRTDASESNGHFSPDGRWVLYQSDEFSGRMEIYVTSFPTKTIRRQVSTAGGIYPKWRADGKEIFYYAPGNQLMATDVNGTGATFEVNRTRALFAAYPTGPGYFYDVSRDGQRFLINAVMEQKVSMPLTVVVNWIADLKR